MYNYWPFVLEDLKTHLSEINFETWFSKVHFVGVVKSSKNADQAIQLKVPSVFSRNYIQKKFFSQLQNSIRKYYPLVNDIELIVDESLEKPLDNSIQQELLNQGNDSQSQINQDQPVELKLEPNNLQFNKNLFKSQTHFHSLNSKYTFDNFVICGSNQLAAIASQSVAAHPGVEYNPLFIYGGVGLGKTHLMQAIGHRILENNPHFKIKYISAESFLNEFLLALQSRKTHEFKNFYRSLDVLLIDDVQFLSGKETSQEELFHTFNELHQHNRQVVLTSDKLPREIPGIEARLISRFGWGMVVDISEPDLEGRIAILQHKARRRGINLSREVVEYIAQNVSTNVRDLEGILNKVLVHANSLGADQTIDLSVVKDCIDSQYLRSHLDGQTSFGAGFNTASPNKIIEIVAEYYGLAKKDLIGTSRVQEISIARQTAMWIMKNHLGMSFPSIGNYFGGKDHTTVMHACKKIEKLRESDSYLNQIKSILKRLKG